jgi:hypothetical protein
MEKNERKQMPLEKKLWQTGRTQRRNKMREEGIDEGRIKAQGSLERSQKRRKDHERRSLSR